jgi:hypothetical protein
MFGVIQRGMKRWLLTFSPGEWIWVSISLLIISGLWIAALT